MKLQINKQELPNNIVFLAYLFDGIIKNSLEKPLLLFRMLYFSDIDHP